MEVRTTLILDQEEYLSLKKRSNELNMSVSRFLRYLFNTYGDRRLNKTKNKQQSRINGTIKNRSLKSLIKSNPDFARVKVFNPIDTGIKFIGLNDGIYTTMSKDGTYRHSVAGGGFCYTRKRYFNPETDETVVHKQKKFFPHELYFYNKNGAMMAAVMYGEGFDYSLESFKKIMNKDEE
jgi:hypothetical protein